ncbi:MAG: DNA methyltransferase [Methanoculleus sp.]
MIKVVREHDTAHAPRRHHSLSASCSGRSHGHHLPILDPFGGTGTTSLAAARWGRNSISIEIEEKYYLMEVERFAHQAN